MSRVTTLRPGLIVMLRTRIVGGVEYQKRDLEAPEAPAEGAATKRWETTRIVPDPELWERARGTRSRCQTIVRGACIKSEVAMLLCPPDREENLRDKISEAEQLAAAFNTSSTSIQVEVNVVCGRIASDDTTAMRAITGEIRELLDAMNAGVVSGDAEAIRAAANRARSMGAMLDEASGQRVTRAIAEAREAAKVIVKRVQDGGELAENVVKDLKLEQLQAARFSFLDMDAPTEQTGEQLPAVAPRGLDLPPPEEPAAPPPAATPSQAVQRDIEF